MSDVRRAVPGTECPHAHASTSHMAPPAHRDRFQRHTLVPDALVGPVEC